MIIVVLAMMLFAGMVFSATGTININTNGTILLRANDNNLIFMGSNVKFKVNQPENWRCYSDGASKLGYNAYFCIEDCDYNSSPAIMYVKVIAKDGYSVEERLEENMKEIKNEFPEVQFKEFSFAEVKNNYSAKLYCYNKKCEYLCYLEPKGKLESSKYVIIGLSGPEEISPNYEADFIKLVQSFEGI